jgi:hypothetical protein
MSADTAAKPGMLRVNSTDGSVCRFMMKGTKAVMHHRVQAAQFRHLTSCVPVKHAAHVSAVQDPRNAALGRLLTAAAMQPPPAGSGRQWWPDYDKDAPPVHLPVEKDAVKLQVRV